MSRRNARKHIFNLIFQLEFNKDDKLEVKETLDTYNEEYKSFDEEYKDFISREYRGIVANLDSIDSYISNYAPGWTIERLAKTELAVLRIGIYEIVFDSEIPDAVAVNESVELAKIFGGDKAPAFVNAVLNNVVKSKTNIEQ